MTAGFIPLAEIAPTLDQLDLVQDTISAAFAVQPFGDATLVAYA